jgi:NADPH:quinone reductase-like Zn-dependent oxidoreductase
VWSSVQVPEPGRGEVRIRVRAAGVQPADLSLRRGETQFELPAHRILGCEVAGSVDAVGPGVRGIALGTNVVAFLPELGGYAQYVNATCWTEKPSHVSWIAAAALPAAASAAGRALQSLALEPQQTLLVLGAAGSVGLIAAQLAAHAGINVVGAAAERDHSAVELAGATPIRDDEPLAGLLEARGLRIDAVIDTAGTDPFDEAPLLLADPDCVVSLASDRPLAAAEACSDGIEDAMRMLAVGGLLMRPQRVLPIEHAAEAHRILEAGGSRQKLVLAVR